MVMLQGKTVLITGASSDIGQAIAINYRSGHQTNGWELLVQADVSSEQRGHSEALSPS